MVHTVVRWISVDVSCNFTSLTFPNHSFNFKQLIHPIGWGWSRMGSLSTGMQWRHGYGALEASDTKTRGQRPRVLPDIIRWGHVPGRPKGDAKECQRLQQGDAKVSSFGQENQRHKGQPQKVDTLTKKEACAHGDLDTWCATDRETDETCALAGKNVRTAFFWGGLFTEMFLRFVAQAAKIDDHSYHTKRTHKEFYRTHKEFYRTQHKVGRLHLSWWLKWRPF